MADDVSRLVEDITERVRQALQSLRAGVDAPRATAAAAAAAAAAGLARDDGAPVAAGCRCCSLEGCGAAVVLREGLGPVGAERLRSGADFAPLIDHTLLKPDASRDEVLTLCEEAVKYGFASVCVNAANVALAAHALRGSTTIPIAVVGFPLGATTPAAKAFEAREAVRCGAREVDMVQNLGALKSKDYALVLQDVVAVVRAAEPWPVKVILETSQLTQDEKIVACALAKAGGATFVKTATGFTGSGATVDDVALMRRIVGNDVGVKASGGVRTQDDARKMVAAGANRLGASASVAIVKGEASTAKY